MGETLRRIRDAWNSLEPTKRYALGIITVGIIGSVALWAFLSSQVTYETAFQGLKPQDASAVVNKLKELQIPYQLNNDGSISVPSSLVNEARVEVAGAGVLTGGNVGFEIFNQPSFGLSNFIQQVDYQRALEGELARSIEQINGISSARVHLALPQPSVFVSQQQSPSAAVVVALKPGQTLDRSQAQAIVSLVVGAVVGMKPAQVALLDTQGQLLDGGTGTTAGDPATVSDHYETQLAMEQSMQSRVQDLLDRILGPGHSSVQVNVQLDWSSGQSTTQTYNPTNQPPIIQASQDITDVQSLTSSVGGIPGVASNVPTYQQAQPTPSQGSGSQKTQAIRNYDVSSTVQKTNQVPGTLQRLTVAVAVDSSVTNPAMVSNLTKMVQAAVGYDATRGDNVSVVAVPLKQVRTTSLPQPAGVSSRQVQTLAMIRSAALIAGPVLAVLILGLLLLRRRTAQNAPTIQTMGVPLVAGPPPPLEAAITNVQAIEGPRRSAIREEITSIAEKDPALVASILQAWVKEDKGTES